MSKKDVKVYGVGTFGIGKYSARVRGVITKEYTSWTNMLQRCYCPVVQSRQPQYIGCTVCEEWLNFQTYAEWCNNQPNFGQHGFAVDKDLLVIGNKLYSPEFCRVIPRRVNKLITSTSKCYKSLPIGVTLNVGYENSINKRYLAVCNNFEGKRVTIGHYDSAEEAHKEYVKFKQETIFKVVEHYKDLIPEDIINNLLSYDFSKQGNH